MSKILMVGPAWVGDMVMAQTLFKLIRQKDPHAVMEVLAPAWSFPLLNRMPEVSAAIPLALTHGQLGLGERYRLGKSLRDCGYTQAIVLPNSWKSALVPFWAKIPKRTGWVGEGRFFLLNDVRYGKSRYPLMIEQLMALGLDRGAALPSSYPYPNLIVSQDMCNASLLKQNLLVGSKPILALCPGAEFGPSKCWPAEYFAEVARSKIKQGWQVWLFGSVKDRVIAEQIMQLTDQQCINLAGRTSLDEAIDLLSLVTSVLTNDSGLMHVAAALQKPLIALYGSTSPSFTPPLSDKARELKLNLACQPCFERTCRYQHYRCMRELTPDQVLSMMDT